jgi:hypothetical protein
MMIFDNRQVAGLVWEQRGTWDKPTIHKAAKRIGIETSHGYAVSLDEYDIAVLRKAIADYDAGEGE